MAGASGLTDLAASVLERVRSDLPDAPLVVALSGGADSAVCAWAAATAGADVRALIIDHGLAASRSLVAAAIEIAERLEIEHTVIPVDPARSEADLRDARYAAIDGDCRDGEIVITGHTADDHVETVVMNLMRGAGATGLSGIPRRRGRYHRPMLGVWRAETRELAASLDLPFVDDPGNTDLSLLRVRVRREIMPTITAVSPTAPEAIVRAAGHVAIDEAALSAAAAAIDLRARDGEVAVARGALLAVSPAVAARVARRMLRMIHAPYAGTAADVEVILGVAAGGAERMPSSGGMVVAREGSEVVLYPAGEANEGPPPVGLVVPGSARWGRWMMSAVVESTEPLLRPVGRWQALVTPASVTGAVMRSAAAGDRIDLADGTKAVFEALREAGVPGRSRPRWPLVAAGGRMVWVPGCRVSGHAAWTEGAGDAVRLIATEVTE
ncbi:tRNA lysidine(34) synthetase TilS [bacterium]|nr:tRNA lysidine(34) synthetase TilS [bacterium]